MLIPEINDFTLDLLHVIVDASVPLPPSPALFAPIVLSPVCFAIGVS